ncbi:hypothetical protein MKW98_025278 [Papaver atlanticum]|uniref:Uncharacterized protein n=1 Tax=Papaver atlanticum TaxID=357466 RepID=A0AAD4X6M0_9MAGN|nr:hypothetical protein MKW98_025278 [Papaver atlanticum]
MEGADLTEIVKFKLLLVKTRITIIPDWKRIGHLRVGNMIYTISAVQLALEWMSAELQDSFILVERSCEILDHRRASEAIKNPGTQWGVKTFLDAKNG